MGQIEKRQLLINQRRKQFGLIESSGKPFLPHRHNHRTENNTIGRREQQNNNSYVERIWICYWKKKTNIRQPFVFSCPPRLPRLVLLFSHLWGLSLYILKTATEEAQDRV